MKSQDLKKLLTFIKKIEDKEIRSRCFIMLDGIFSICKLYLTAKDSIAKEIHYETMTYQIGSLLAFVGPYALSHINLLVQEELIDLYKLFSIT